jgi:Family of unknown function (DUF6084)
VTAGNSDIRQGDLGLHEAVPRARVLLDGDALTESAQPAPEPEFAVLGARAQPHAAVPTLLFDLQISEGSGRPLYMIALTVQLMIEPARRVYDDATRERLEGLFGPPERWSMTTRSLVWAQLDVVVPAFTGTTIVPVPVLCNYDMEVAAAKYLHALPDGEAPLALHFNGMVYYPGADGALQMVLIPWSRSIDFRMPVSVWRETIERFYPGTAWVALREDTVRALERRRVGDGQPTYDECLRRLLAEGEQDV